jgi:cyclic pyranopterin phosphate synthase
MLRDSHNRPITDLRVSVTNGCNFRCVYCRSADGDNGFHDNGILEWSELERLCRIFLGLGIRKIRVTGGEPLVRRGVLDFIACLSQMGVQDLSMTTNGHLLDKYAGELHAAGLHRINISLDSIHPEKFARITRTNSFTKVMAGVEAAQQAGLVPVKVNAVIVRGLNDDEIEDFGQFARERGVTMRFIEFMPLDADHRWQRNLVVTAEEILQRLQRRWELVPIGRDQASETALKYRFADGRGEIGLVASVSKPFCGFCSRIRLTADGKIRTCLFSMLDHDVKSLLRGGRSDEAIAEHIAGLVSRKEEGHRINEADFQPPSRTMVYIGG